MFLIGKILLLALDIYMWIIIAEVVISWLAVFGVINLYNPSARNLVALISKCTEPVMGRVRKFIPPIAGLDLSPLVVIFAISILKQLVVSYIMF